MKNTYRAASLLAGAALLSGCAAGVIPERTGYGQKAAQEQLPLAWTGTASQGAQSVSSLKMLTNDKALLSYVDLILANNTSLKQSVLDAQLAELQRQKATGARLPNVTATAQAGRERARNTDTLAFSTGNSVGGTVGLAWELDLWGKLSDRADAAGETRKAVGYDLQAARVSLTGQAMRNWLQLSLQHQLAALDQSRIESLKRNEQSISERFSRGIGELGDLEAARTVTANAESDLIARQLGIDRLKRQMQVMAGQIPTTRFASPSRTPKITLPKEQVPAAILGRRPDVLAAYQRAVAADKGFSATYKDILPSFSINLTAGDQVPNLGSMFSGGPAWAMIGSIAAPLFEGGSRRLKARQADLVAARAWLDYRDVVLNALLEVEDGLQSERVLRRQEAILTRALQHANNNYDQFERRYRDGLTDIVTLLIAEQSAIDARIALLELKNSRRQNRINLAVALGIGL